MPKMSAAALQRALAEGRRGARRYDITLPLRFAALRRGQPPITGKGESVNVSRSGMLFRCDERLVVGDAVIAVLDWPVSAPDHQPLKLVVTGNAVRMRRGAVAVAIHTHRLLRESDLDDRLSAFWDRADDSRPRRAPEAPVVLIEDDDTVALTVSLVLAPQNWVIERADLEQAKAMIASGAALSLVVTRSPELLEGLKPETPAIVTLDESAPESDTGQIAGHQLRVAVRRPLTNLIFRSLVGVLCGSSGRATADAASQWTH